MVNVKGKSLLDEAAMSCHAVVAHVPRYSTGAKPRAQRRTCVKCRGEGHVFALRQMGPYMTRAPVACPSCDGEGHTYRSQDA